MKERYILSKGGFLKATPGDSSLSLPPVLQRQTKTKSDLAMTSPRQRNEQLRIARRLAGCGTLLRTLDGHAFAGTQGGRAPSFRHSGLAFCRGNP